MQAGILLRGMGRPLHRLFVCLYSPSHPPCPFHCLLQYYSRIRALFLRVLDGCHLWTWSLLFMSVGSAQGCIFMEAVSNNDSAVVGVHPRYYRDWMDR